jgi:hypothetical protein
MHKSAWLKETFLKKRFEKARTDQDHGRRNQSYEMPLQSNVIYMLQPINTRIDKTGQGGPRQISTIS